MPFLPPHIIFFELLPFSRMHFTNVLENLPVIVFVVGVVGPVCLTE
ncbi:MAG: hypothetical protein QXS29_06215 [Nitrososphaeria archaeon]